MEKIIEVKLKKKSYKIFVEQNILSKCGKHLNDLNLGKKILIVTQDKIPQEIIQKVRKSLSRENFKVFIFKLSQGEKYKNLNSLLRIIKFALKNKFERNDSFLAIGGGVVSDLTGFAASIYKRSVNFIVIPTTLLGMVDASVGGKTGIDLKEGKNLLGTFYQPRIILIDPNCLNTLPKKEFINGMAEVIKYALLEKSASMLFSKSNFFSFLKQNKNKILKLQLKPLLRLITHSILIKAMVVSRDEKETNLRAILNLGHTFAHGIEQAFNYKTYTHGESVAIGICLASRLSKNLRLITEKQEKQVVNLITSFNLPTKLKKNKNIKKIMSSMLHDKKIKNGKLRFVLPVNEIGKVKIVSNIKLKEIAFVLREL